MTIDITCPQCGTSDGRCLRQEGTTCCYARVENCMTAGEAKPDTPQRELRYFRDLDATAPAGDPLRELLDEAAETVAARGKPYGGVEDNFARIARLWTAHLANRYDAHAILKLDPTDVAIMMILLKTARLANDPAHRDSWVDVAGYAACGGSLPAP